MLRAVWGAHHPSQLEPVGEVARWRLDAEAKSEIDRILRESVSDPVGPEFMAPASRRSAAQIGGIRAELLECKRRAVTVEIPMSFAKSAVG
jgi:hypothetical protein